MGPISIYDKSVIATIQEWIRATSEVFVELYYPHSSGSGTYYFVSSFSQFSEMTEEARSGAIFLVLRQPQFPIRGAVNDSFIEKTLEAIPDGERYAIVEAAFYPKATSSQRDGHTHAELKKDLEDCRGMAVCVGKEPSLPSEYWAKNQDPDSIIAFKRPQISMFEWWRKLFFRARASH
jgi:hypothetical protein